VEVSGLVIASICARGGSKGVPRKNLREVRGRTLIARCVEQAIECGIFDHVVASSDDPEMAEAARRAGAEVPGLRPPELARDDTNKWLVFRYLVEKLESHTRTPVAILADLDTGVLLREPRDIADCVTRLSSADAEVCVTAYEADHNPYYNMVELDAANVARVCLAGREPICNRQQAPPVYNLSPATFAIRRSALFEKEHWSQCKMALSVIPRERALDVDTELDLRLLEALVDERDGRGRVR
jgi:N-acylneuraminate cytidylyltransferase/CMP-N,N'-diacetyllegionaminic acid synthase